MKTLRKTIDFLIEASSVYNEIKGYLGKMRQISERHTAGTVEIFIYCNPNEDFEEYISNILLEYSRLTLDYSDGRYRIILYSINAY